MEYNNSIKDISINNLLKNELYFIPIYQRGYAWEETQITQLLLDIVDTMNKGYEIKYYLGTLVTNKTIDGRSVSYEVIDGQQRLTTLTILAIYLKNSEQCTYLINIQQPNLSFANRPISTKTISELSENLGHLKSHNSITDAYNIITSKLSQILKESDIEITKFSKYLFEKVTILRVEVPKDTDLNHYFEIMNNRGEQLEKHEIVKSKLMSKLEEQSRSTFNKIWEACSDMNRYVQYNFIKSERDVIFGNNNWNILNAKCFGDILHNILNVKRSNDIIEQKSNNVTSLNIQEILKGSNSLDISNNDGKTESDRFYTVIDFPNFLLHVLRLTLKAKDISLDDKQLLNHFDKLLEKDSNDIEEFAFNLLKIRFLFDKYIIKREVTSNNQDGRWSLQRMKWYPGDTGNYVKSFNEDDKQNQDDKQNRIVQLLSMFHVSVPTMNYKYWLLASLKYLFENNEAIEPDNYISKLESIAEQFIYNRILKDENPAEYNDMIFEPREINYTVDTDKLTFGNITNNLLFNYVDYLLWIKEKSQYTKIKDFEFIQRSSVEHYYPQNPKDGVNKIEDEKLLNSFGNLCLVSHSKNSELSNFSPKAKKEQCNNRRIESVKQHLMMNYDTWNEDSIIKHNREMQKLLKICRG